MKAKNKINPERLSSDYDNNLPERLERRVARLVKRVSFLVEGKDVPAHLREPQWLNNIVDRLSEMSLPLKGKSPVFCDAARKAYHFAERKKMWETLLTHEPCTKEEAQLIEQLRENIERGLGEYSWEVSENLVLLSPPDSLEFLRGLAFGIECSLRETATAKPVRASARWPLFVTILRYKEEIELLAKQRATVDKISEFIAKSLPGHYRKTYADFFSANENAWPPFVNRVYKLCKEIGIDNFPQPGRPKRK